MPFKHGMSVAVSSPHPFPPLLPPPSLPSPPSRPESSPRTARFSRTARSSRNGRPSSPAFVPAFFSRRSALCRAFSRPSGPRSSSFPFRTRVFRRRRPAGKALRALPPADSPDPHALEILFSFHFKKSVCFSLLCFFKHIVFWQKTLIGQKKHNGKIGKPVALKFIFCN